MGRDSGSGEKSPYKKYRCIHQRIHERVIANLRIGFIEWYVLRFVSFLNVISLHTLLRSSRRIWKNKTEDEATEILVLCFLSFLILLNFLQPWLSNLRSIHSWVLIPNCILIIIASWITIGVYAVLLSIFFLVRYSLQRPPVSINRSLILLFINFFEMVFFFSLLYLLSQSVIATDCGNTIATPLDSIYFSVITITTLGYGDLRPVGFWGRLIVIFEALTGFLFIVVIFSSFLQMSRPHDRKE